uniref:Retrovirus-related Pol polyprotein from transposon TNT 1-94 n=1 Tax=Tanacetum cinerariifolium TaxID=118510 RepID=A0A6L2NQ89_TANCI|nr:retrovirus-related Pol polyprotein from transposon TNT 1-94 [Tanacetum cinerariifolium]
MGLLDFVKSSDPFKVKVWERTLTEEDVLLSKETEDIVISPSRDVICIMDHTVVDDLKSAGGKKKRRVDLNDVLSPVKKAIGSSFVASLERNPTNVGKTLVVLKRLVIQSSQQDVGFGPAIAAMDEFVSSSVTPTLDREYQDESVSTQDENVKTHPASNRFVVISPGVERRWLSKAEGFILPNHGTVCSNPLPSLKKLDGAEPVFEPKNIKSILKSNFTFKAEALKDVVINEPSSALAKGNKKASASKVNSAHAGKFDEKANDGYFLRYSLVSKAFRVFKARRKQTEETYHITIYESPDAIKFIKPSVDNINIVESQRYTPKEYLYPHEPSKRYQINRNDVSFIEPYKSSEPVVLETEVSSDQNGQADQNDHNDQNVRSN